MPSMNRHAIDLDRLLKLRLVVARFGEMDLAKWWNTKGQLGRLGTAALRRGFPRTHYFAQARSVFAVAGHRRSEGTRLNSSHLVISYAVFCLKKKIMHKQRL